MDVTADVNAICKASLHADQCTIDVDHTTTVICSGDSVLRDVHRLSRRLRRVSDRRLQRLRVDSSPVCVVSAPAGGGMTPFLSMRCRP